MLKSTRRKTSPHSGNRFAIVCSQYNPEYTQPMCKAAETVLSAAGARFEVVSVPGAFEIPVAAAALLARKSAKPEAVLCLGLILQGETNHADHIGEAVTRALMDLSIRTGIPCIHEVLTVQTREQAEKRCVAEETNRGAEAAHTGLRLAATLNSLRRGPGRR